MKKFALATFALYSPYLFAHQTEIYAGVHHHYMHLDTGLSSNFKGFMTGVDLGVQYRNAHYRTSLDYEGSWDSGPIVRDPCDRTEVKEHFLCLRAGGSWRSKHVEIEPYIGFGWNRFDHDPTGALYYKYDKLCVPVGLYINCPWSSIEFGLQGEWRPDVWSQVKVMSSHLNPKWGHGFRLQFNAKHYSSLKCAKSTLFVNLAPYFDWNKYGRVSESNSVGALLEFSEIKRWNLGARLQIGLEF